MLTTRTAPLPPCKLPLHDIWRLYHLLRGGIDSPLLLESLAGVSVRGIDLDALYLWADQEWINSDCVAVPLAKKKTVLCARCDRTCRSVPCLRCEAKGRGANWLRKKTVSTAGDYRNDANRRICQSSIQYSGSPE